MRLLLQRVNSATVTVDSQIIGQIGHGVLVFLGVTESDGQEDIDKLVDKVINLRMFAQDDKKFDLTVQDIKGEILVVSQFTLYGNCKNGRRPDFIEAASPNKAELLYKKFIDVLRDRSGLKVETGQFAAYMQVELENDGPVTFWLDSK